MFSSNDRALASAEAFTNRQAQWAAFLDALARHQAQQQEPGFDVQDVEAPRHNVLVFHGVGGIGKTTLSAKIEASLRNTQARPSQWPAPPVQLLPIRIDLARAAGTDFEQLVLTLRLALTDTGRPMPAFDVFLRRWWEAHHPGEPLEEYLRRGGLAARFAGAIRLPEQLQSTLADVAGALSLPGTVGAAGAQLIGSLVTALRQRNERVTALAGCHRLADLLEADLDLDTLSYATHLLAWDITQLPATKRPVPVVLLDTFEEVGDRTHRELERLIQHVVYLMPNTMFVITGRDRLQWADAALSGQLDFTGPTAWPDLAAGPDTHPRGQVLIGDFSPQDCDAYLAHRLTSGNQPLIGADIRNTITRRSHGLPLHLELSISRFLEIRRSGRTPVPEDFDHPFPALIVRTVRDLTPDERHVLRSVSLLDAFSIPLATRVAGLDRDAAALRLAERPFITEDPAAPWPYHLHQLIRAAIRDSTADTGDDRWSSNDWRRAAERAHTALGEEWTEGPRRDRTVLIACLRQGLALAAEYGLALGWLIEAAFAYVGDSVWEPLTPSMAESTDRPDTAAAALLELLTTLRQRQHEHRERTVARLAELIATELLPRQLADMATYYRAKAERDIGRADDSRRHMEAVLAGGGRQAPAARRGLVHLARLRGDFPAAFAAAQELGWEGRQQRVLGDLYWPHGRVHEAADAYRAGRREAEQHGKAGETATCQALCAFALAFTDPERADDELDLAEELLAGVDLRASSLNAQMAALVRDAGTTSGWHERFRSVEAAIDIAGLASAAPTLQLVACFHAAVLQDDAAMQATIGRLRELTANGDSAHLVDVAHMMAAHPASDNSSTRWLDEPEQVRRRWRDLITTRQQRRAGPAGTAEGT
nr:ATP/GTP-binding protein [Streptomyces coryli]